MQHARTAPQSPVSLSKHILPPLSSFYDEEYVTTAGGYLNISTNAAVTRFVGMDDKSGTRMLKTKHFKSGMVQGWNKFCFTGGIAEIRTKLPGQWYTGGFWPAIWLMGNLARATYVGSSDWVS